MLLIPRDDSLSVINFWVDASFAAHPNCKGHTGAMVSRVSGSIMEISWKKKIDRRISTEAEIVGSYNALTQCLWLRYFIEEQGYEVLDIDFCQDNMSSMLM